MPKTKHIGVIYRVGENEPPSSDMAKYPDSRKFKKDERYRVLSIGEEQIKEKLLSIIEGNDSFQLAKISKIRGRIGWHIIELIK